MQKSIALTRNLKPTDEGQKTTKTYTEKRQANYADSDRETTTKCFPMEKDFFKIHLGHVW